MKFLINVFLSFSVYGFTKSLNQGTTLSYEGLKNEKILVKDSFQRPGFSEFITVDGKISIKKKKMSRQKFQQWLQQDKIIFFSQFGPSPSPYAGPISNQIECIKSLKPKPLFTNKKKTSLIMEGFVYKSNNRFVALSCQNVGDPAYDSAYIAIHCDDFGYKIAIYKRNKLKEVKTTELMKATTAFACSSHTF